MGEETIQLESVRVKMSGGGGGGRGGRGGQQGTYLLVKKEILSLGMHFAADRNDKVVADRV